MSLIAKVDRADMWETNDIYTPPESCLTSLKGVDWTLSEHFDWFIQSLGGSRFCIVTSNLEYAPQRNISFHRYMLILHH